MDKIIAYTDGSANWKNGLGGLGIYIIDGCNERFFHQGFSNTKTGRMEIKAVIICLHKIKDKTKKVSIYSDSQYTTNCVNKKWLWSWEFGGWNGMANVDLMKQYLEEIRKFKYQPRLIHIKGHTRKDDIHSLGNAIVDSLASYKQFKTYSKDEDTFTVPSRNP
jgi:ribonuclease HI